MNSADYPVYDFLTASKVERSLAIALEAWLTKFNKLFRERWADFAPSDIQVTSTLINALNFDVARCKWTRPTIASPISLKSLDKKTEVPGLIIAECSDIVILMMEILSETLTERPAARELTSIELSMCQLLFQTSVAALSEAWLDKEMLPISLGDFDFQPNNSRLFTPTKEVVVTGFEVRTSSSRQAGPAKFEWVLAKDELMNLLGVRKGAQAPSNPQKIDPDLVSQIDVEVTAKLGTTELSMAALLQLAPGAIVRLDQRVDQPLVLMLNGQPKLVGWPGKSNQKPCVLIDSILE